MYRAISYLNYFLSTLFLDLGHLACRTQWIFGQLRKAVSMCQVL